MDEERSTGKVVLVTLDAPESVRAAIEDGLDGAAEVVYLSDVPEEKRAAVLSSANVVMPFFFNNEVRVEEYPLLGGVELFQSVSTGLEFLPFSLLPEKMILACNAGS